MQLVYLVRTGNDNKTLRYSLRSVAAFAPKAEVIIAGYKPSWVKNTEHIPVPQPVRHHRNQVKILKEVCKVGSIVDEGFVLMNDDFFLLRPMTESPALAHRGPIKDLVERGAWRRGFYGQSLTNTVDLLLELGVVEPLYAFDGMHTPFPVEKSYMRQCLRDAGDQDVQHRSLYGNLVMGEDAQQAEDAKIRIVPKHLPDAPWVSCSRRAWQGGVNKLMARKFPDKCSYEI